MALEEFLPVRGVSDGRRVRRLIGAVPNRVPGPAHSQRTRPAGHGFPLIPPLKEYLSAEEDRVVPLMEQYITWRSSATPGKAWRASYAGGDTYLDGLTPIG